MKFLLVELSKDKILGESCRLNNHQFKMHNT